MSGIQQPSSDRFEKAHGVALKLQHIVNHLVISHVACPIISRCICLKEKDISEHQVPAGI